MRFWDLIELARSDSKAFVRKLYELSEEELVEFFWNHIDAEGDVYDAGIENHMAIASEDATRMLAEWVVDQGVDYNDRVLDDLSEVPRGAPNHLPDFRGAAQSVYEKRFGKTLNSLCRRPRK